MKLKNIFFFIQIIVLSLSLVSAATVYEINQSVPDDSDYKNWFGGTTNPGGRSFMSKKIFAHLAYRNGFEIIDQTVIDWSVPKLDCITLVRK